VQCSRASEHLVPQIQSHRRSDLHAGQAEAEPITYIAGRWLASDKDSARARGSDSDGFSRRRRRRKRNLKRVDGMEWNGIHSPSIQTIVLFLMRKSSGITDFFFFFTLPPQPEACRPAMQRSICIYSFLFTSCFF
jgi:hypothetical protein